MFDFLKSSKHNGLEAILKSVYSNMENNYKDEAQKSFKELVRLYEELDNARKLNEKQKEHYRSVINSLEIKLKDYSHKDQKPFWT